MFPAGLHRHTSHLFHLGIRPSHAILLRQMIGWHLRRSRPEKILTVLQQYASGFFEPVAVHLPAAPSPRNEGLLGQTPALMHRAGWVCSVLIISFRQGGRRNFLSPEAKGNLPSAVAFWV